MISLATRTKKRVEKEVVLPRWFTDDVVLPYKAGIGHIFLLHGDINGLVVNQDRESEEDSSHIPVRRFLEKALDGRDMVILYNLASGIKFLDSDMEAEFRRVTGIDKGDSSSADPIAAAKAGLAAKRGIPRDPDTCLALIEKVAKSINGVGVIINSTHFIAPASTGGGILLPNERVNVERIKNWGQLVRGPSLERVLQFRTFTPLSAWAIVRPVTEALGFGHRQQVLHRDLKTANILLDADQGSRPHVYLSDFGLGKRPGFDRTLTADGISVGTPEYMAPEVAMGGQADPRADLYSMGVMIYEMLLGRLPFQGQSAQMIALAHVDDPVPRPRLLRRDFPRSLETLLLRGLEKRPDARFQTADELRQAYFEALSTLDEAARRQCYWVEQPRA